MPKKTNKLSQNSNHDLKESLLKIQSAVLEAGGDVKDKTSDLVNELLDNIEAKKDDYENELRNHIIEKPIKSVAVALGIGIIIGKILL